MIPGAVRFDFYSSPGGTGDLTKAREELAACGVPAGFDTRVSYRSEVPRERETAEALQQSLSRIGIRLELAPFPLADYYTLYAGKPDYARDNDLGLMVTAWAADWPDGYGFLAQIVDSRTIRPTGGNANLGVRDPRVDQLLDEALRTPDTAVRGRMWADVDQLVMAEARVLPGVWGEGPFLPAAAPDERVHHRRVPDVRLSRARYDPSLVHAVDPLGEEIMEPTAVRQGRVVRLDHALQDRDRPGDEGSALDGIVCCYGRGRGCRVLLPDRDAQPRARPP